jgi:hypothetical protein
MTKKILMMSAAAFAFAGGAYAQYNASGDVPPNAEAGECFARVLIPETTEVVTEQVVDRPEASEIKLIAAEYETVTEQVLVKQESVTYEVVPAVYETVTEEVIVEPARVEKIVVPAKFETYTEQVLVRPAYTTWKPGAGLFGRGSAGVGTTGLPGEVATGELLCKVEVPAQYDTVTRTRMVTPESTTERTIPAVTKTVTKQVVREAPRVVERVIPAEYGTVQVRRLVSPAREDVITIPATYKTVEKRVVTAPGGLQWREVLCDTNASPAKLQEIQRALTAAGYETPADGSFGPQTLRAMEAFQRARGLPVGYLTVDTVAALGVTP